MMVLLDTDVLLDIALARPALTLPMNDIEDSFQTAAAVSWGADFIITCNLPGYKHAPVPAISPAAFLQKFI